MADEVDGVYPPHGLISFKSAPRRCKVAGFVRYEASAYIDRQITDLLKRFPIEDYPHVWVEFCRTVRSTLNIIEKESMAFLGGK